MKFLFIVTIYNHGSNRYWRLAISAPDMVEAEAKSKGHLGTGDRVFQVSRICATPDDVNKEI